MELRRSTVAPKRLSVNEWRRGEDLNPRGTCAPIRFRVGRLQPGSATPPHWFFKERLILRDGRAGCHCYRVRRVQVASKLYETLDGARPMLRREVGGASHHGRRSPPAEVLDGQRVHAAHRQSPRVALEPASVLAGIAQDRLARPTAPRKRGKGSGKPARQTRGQTSRLFEAPEDVSGLPLHRRRYIPMSSSESDGCCATAADQPHASPITTKVTLLSSFRALVLPFSLVASSMIRPR